MLFETIGPVTLTREEYYNRQFGLVWDKLSEWHEETPFSWGCYTMGLSLPNDSTPWYVGMTMRADGFRGEVFHRHKLEHYDAVLEENGRGEIFFLFFSAITDSAQSYSWNYQRCNEFVRRLERHLIALAQKRNPDLRNIRDTRFFRELHVPGIHHRNAVDRREGWQRAQRDAANFARRVFAVGQ